MGFHPPQVSNAEIYPKEIEYGLTTNKYSYKNLSIIKRNLYNIRTSLRYIS